MQDKQETNIELMENAPVSQAILKLSLSTVFSTSVSLLYNLTDDVVKATIVNLGRQCLFYIPLLLLLNRVWKLNGLLYAQPMADILTTLTAVIISVPMLKKLYQECKKIKQTGGN